MKTANDVVRWCGFINRTRHSFVRLGLILASLLCEIALSSAGVAKDARLPLLVYYGDETVSQASESENYAALLEVLRSSTSPRAGVVADNIVKDAERFPLLVKRDIEALKGQAERLGFDLAIFTNALAFDGKYQLHRTESGTTETHKLPDIPPTSSTILATSPLSRPEYLRAGLLSVSGLYPPGSLDMVLITNGHGGRDVTLMPRVNADLSEAGAALAMRQMLESDDNGVPPAWARVQGTSKRAYWEVLAEVSAAHGVRFPLVFRETCVSGVRTFAELFAIPDSVGLIAHSGRGQIDGWDLDYTQMLGAVGLDSDWIAALSVALKDRDVYVDTWMTAWFGVLLIALDTIPSVVFFVPLALWIAWYATRRLRSRRAKMSWARS